MASASINKSATAALNPHGQSLDTVHKLVANILGRAGCAQCGRIALLKVDFVGDPGPDLAGLGAISLHTEGF